MKVAFYFRVFLSLDFDQPISRNHKYKSLTFRESPKISQKSEFPRAYVISGLDSCEEARFDLPRSSARGGAAQVPRVLEVNPAKFNDESPLTFAHEWGGGHWIKEMERLPKLLQACKYGPS